MNIVPAVLAADPTPLPTTAAARSALPSINIGNIFGFGDIKSLGDGISLLIPAAFTIAGLAVVIYFVLAAIRLIFSGGDKAKIQAAKETITHSIIGVILLVLTFLILPYIVKYFGIDIPLFKR